MLRTILALLSGLIVASATACGSSPSTSSATSPAASSPAAAAKSTPSSGPIAACTALNAQDASTLAGVTFTAGTEAGPTCSYMSGQSLVVLSVVQVPNSAAVQAALRQQQATLGASGFTQTQLSGADSAYELIQTGGGASISVIEVVRGNTLFAIEAIGVAPTEALLKAAATTVLGRLP
jgi:hypothetical protein